MINPSEALLSESERAKLERIRALVELGARGVDQLIDALSEPAWTLRRHVVSALAGLGDAAVPALCRVLTEHRRDETQLAAAVEALSASIGLVETQVVAMAESQDPAVVADAAHILGRRRCRAQLSVLERLTTHENDNVAVAALEALGRIGGRAAVETLVLAIQSGNFFRTFPAIDVLGRSGDPRAVPALTKLLDHPHYAPEATRALGRTGERAAVGPLVELLDRGSDSIARVAVVALSDLRDRHEERYGGRTLNDALYEARRPNTVLRLLEMLSVADPNEQVAICNVLGVLGDHGAVPRLTSLIGSPSAAVAQAANRALRLLGREADEQLTRELRNANSERRRHLLPLVGSRFRAADAVTACLSDPDPVVRTLACECLAKIGNPGVVEALFGVLGDEHPGVAHSAVGAIQSLGSADTERLALQAAKSDNLRVRRSAFRVIAYLGYASAANALLDALRDPDEVLRDIAISALPLLDDERAMEALLMTARGNNARARAASMRALGQCGNDMRAVAYLLRGLSDSDAWCRYYACKSLGKIGWAAAVDEIVKLLNDDAGQVRVAAVEALAMLDSEASARALADASRSSDGDVQRAALLGLGITKRPDGLPILIAAASAQEATTRLIAISAIAGFEQPEALDVLARAAMDTEPSVQSAAIGFLGARDTQQATRVLIRVLQDQGESEAVLAALARPSEPRITAILEALSSADHELSQHLISVLARMRHPHATRGVFEAASMSNVAARKAAAITLGAFATPDALEQLNRMSARDPDQEVRRICTLVLAQ